MIYNVLTQADTAEKILFVVFAARAATSLFSGPRGCQRSNTSDYKEFVLLMEEHRALMADVHLVRMFCSTKACALDVLRLRQALVN